MTYSYYMLTSEDPGETHDMQMSDSMTTLIPGRRWGCPNQPTTINISFKNK